jgi:hypothetical protein
VAKEYERYKSRALQGRELSGVEKARYERLKLKFLRVRRFRCGRCGDQLHGSARQRFCSARCRVAAHRASLSR